MKSIFKNAGIKKKDLRNTETALCIYEKLLSKANFSNVKFDQETKPKEKKIEEPNEPKLS